MRELEYPFDAEWILKKKVKLRKQLLSDENMVFLDKRIAILGGSTTNEIKKMLELFLLNIGIRPEFYESEYNRFYEDGMFDAPGLVSFRPDIIYIHTSSRNITDWPEVTDTKDCVEKKLNTFYEKFEGLWGHLEETHHCPVIQNNFELPYYRLLGNQDAAFSQGRGKFVLRLNLLFSEYAENHENFYIHDINYESSLFGLEKWADPGCWYMYKYAMALSAIPYTAYQIALIIKSIYGKNKKAFSLDLDNTLWGGVIGDDGAECIEIGQETPLGQVYYEFQSYLRQQKQLGILLTVNSKNNEETARQGFRRQDSVLKEEDFVAFKANWEPKNQNLLETAEELKLLPESFVFVDDNPAERELVRQSGERAAVPEISKPEDMIRILDRSGYFEVTTLSEDDVRRNEMYRAESRRTEKRKSFTDYTEYLKSLEMRAKIQPFVPDYMGRISQLTNKSNQFNLTTRRYSLAELEKIQISKEYLTLYGKLEDCFGDNGVVSVIIGKKEGNALHIELWLMSCRVLKRTMEDAMLDELVAQAQKLDIEKIYGYYYPTAKNAMVNDFYGQMGFMLLEEDDDGNRKYQLDLTVPYEKRNHTMEVNNQRRD